MAKCRATYYFYLVHKVIQKGLGLITRGTVKHVCDISNLTHAYMKDWYIL